jgi:hypothetical protein
MYADGQNIQTSTCRCFYKEKYVPKYATLYIISEYLLYLHLYVLINMIPEHSLNIQNSWVQKSSIWFIQKKQTSI